MEIEALEHQPPLVELRGVEKWFGGVHAVAAVDLAVARGSIHGLVGENGAGKSTLGKVIAGVIQHDAGDVCVAGRPVKYRSPREALNDGVAMIAQELTLVPRLSVIENVFLGVESGRLGLLDERDVSQRYEVLNEQAGFDLAPLARVGSLRVADQQKVEILRALARDARLIIMDEPTAALSKVEAETLFEIIRALRAKGTTLVYISHFLDEVLNLVDYVSVLKDGHLVRTAPATQERSESLVTAMLGRSLNLAFPQKAFPPDNAPVVFEAKSLTRAGAIEDISFEIRAGEILGLAGLVGSGRSEVGRAIFGADALDAGEIKLNGRRLKVRHPRGAVRAGIAMLPESRKTQGLLMGRSVAENMTLPDLDQVTRATFIARQRERKKVLRLVERVDVRPRKTEVRVGSLSGGNQQKVLFAKWLFRRPDLFIADEPTRGVDVGAKRAIYELVKNLAADGIAVLLISSELEEILGLAHRVLVMRNGRIVAEMRRAEMTEDMVMAAAFGVERLSTKSETGAIAAAFGIEGPSAESEDEA